MEYTFHNDPIPQAARREVNDKILYLIDQDLADRSGITREDIYNAYTGDGGLHGLNSADFANYHAFAEAKKEIENGQFFTPHAVCRFMMEALAPSKTDTVADLTAGTAAFANFMPVEANFYGCELDVKSWKVARYLYPQAVLTRGDIRFYTPAMPFDMVVGNPPFNLKWETEDGEMVSQMYYCLKAARLLKPLGLLAVVVPASFLSDEFMDGAKISELSKNFSFLGGVFLQKDTFKALGVDAYPTKILFFQRLLDSAKSGTPYSPKSAKFYHWTAADDPEALLETVRQEIMAPAKERIRQNAARIHATSAGTSAFDSEVRKILYHIRTNPKLVDKYARCQELLYKFQTQEQPRDMEYKEWAKVRLTEAKVLASLRRVLRSQNKKPPEDVVRLIKRDYELAWKGYSQKARKTIPDWKTPVPLYALASGQTDSPELAPFARLIRRKQADYARETKPFADMTEDAAIGAYLAAFTVYDPEREEWIHLNDIQRHDLNLILQKRFSLLQWEQGGGKTLAGIATGKYRMECQNAKNVWVVSTAISVKNNWDPVLSAYEIPYRMVRRLADLEAVRPGEFVLVTLNALVKYRKQIKRHLRIRGGNISLVFDESDEMTNPDSKRTKAVLDCFRRVRFKLLMTGTVTRNNISECAPQLELLYNNSYNQLSWAETLYSFEKDAGGEPVLHEDANPYYGHPVPAYKPGYRLFSASHLPERITVFGVGKRNQDIYNAAVLDDILAASVITRTFAEITGREIRHIHQTLVSFTPAEQAVYKKAVDEFYTLREHYFSLTGNARKDSMMALVQQITLLLRIAAAPNTVSEYQSPEAPVKLRKVCDLVSSFPEEVVVIGVRHKLVVDAYAQELCRRFPDRPLFVVTGDTTTLSQRRRLRHQLEESRNGIMVCTQQCLPSSVNFEFVNKVIIPELHYNDARMSQFYMRFVRFTSMEDKDIYFVTYSGSIESNQMQMVLAKEKLNLYMKGQNVDLDEIYERYGVDYDLLNLLMSREKDEDGRFHISWGAQGIA